jgi:hypothetical protein
MIRDFVGRTPSVAIGLMLAAGALGLAHDGPPFPIVTNQTAGAYEISVWTDPDTTDDGTPGGQFWVTVYPAADSAELPAGTRAEVSIAPVDRAGPTLVALASPVDGKPTRQFAALVMNHEGRYRVHAVVDGPLGRAEVNGEVDATYDLRPQPFLIVVFVLPFVLVGFLWVKLLLRRRRTRSV